MKNNNSCGETDKSSLDTPATLVPQIRAIQNHIFYNFDPSFYSDTLKVFEGSPIVETRTLYDVIYYPKHQSFYYSDGTLVDYSWSPMWGTKFPTGTPTRIDRPTKLSKISQRFIYGGLIYRHYGHFLTDCISRLWYSLKHEDLPILCQEYLNPHIREDFVDFFMNSLGLSKGRFISIQKPILFREIVLPHPTFRFSSEIFSAHKFLPEAVARKIISNKIERSAQPLYFSRRNLTRKNSFRNIKREDELEEVFLDKKFKIVYPERLSLKEQIYLINKHEVLIGVCGSALHGILFNLSSCINLVCITDNTFSNSNFILIDAIKHSKSLYVDALMQEKDSAKEIWKQDRIINLDTVTSTLKEAGIL